MRRNGGWGLRGAAPLIDLLFILLFGLLALSESRTATQAETVRVRLPRVEPQSDRTTGERRTIVLEIDGRSRVRLEGAEAPLRDPGDLDAAIAALMGEAMVPEEFVVEIRGDGAARHGVVVPLLQHLRNRGFAGVHLLALGVEDASWSEDPR